MPLRYSKGRCGMSLEEVSFIIKRDSPITDDMLDHLYIKETFLGNPAFITVSTLYGFIGDIYNGKFSLINTDFISSSDIEFLLKLMSVSLFKNLLLIIQDDIDMYTLLDIRMRFINIIVRKTSICPLKLFKPNNTYLCNMLIIDGDVSNDMMKFIKSFNPRIVKIINNRSQEVIDYFMDRCQYIVLNRCPGIQISIDDLHRVFSRKDLDIETNRSYRNMDTDEILTVQQLLELVPYSSTKSAR